MKRLLIFPPNYLPNIGGLETHVHGLVKHLPPSYQSTIFVPNVVHGKERESVDGATIIRYPAFHVIPNFPVPKFWSPKFWSMFFELYRKKWDIVMTRTMFFPNCTLGWFFAKIRLHRLPLVHVEHGSSAPQLGLIKSFIGWLYIHTLGWLLVASAERVIGVSNGCKEYLRRFRSDVSVIYRGVDFPTISAAKLSYKKPIITFVGRLIEGKGVQDLILAVKGMNCTLLVVGEGGYRNALELLAKKNRVRAVFTGGKSREDVYRILAASDVFVNPSYTEGLPTSVLDAIVADTKIVATDVGGTAEILGSLWKTSGYALIPARDVSQLRTAIQNVLVQKKKSVQSLIKNKFSWQAHAKAYDKVMRSL